MYNMYMNENTKINGFVYKKKAYPAGTKVLYSGECILNQDKLIVNNIIVSVMYFDGKYMFFKDNSNTYKCTLSDFEKNIMKIVTDENKAPPVKAKEEFYWTDSMVTKTIWYVIIMLVATIFHDRIGIWILATVVWYFSTFKNK